MPSLKKRKTDKHTQLQRMLYNFNADQWCTDCGRIACGCSLAEFLGSADWPQSYCTQEAADVDWRKFYSFNSLARILFFITAKKHYKGMINLDVVVARCAIISESVDGCGFKISVCTHPWRRQNGWSSSTYDIIAAHQVIIVTVTNWNQAYGTLTDWHPAVKGRRITR